MNLNFLTNTFRFILPDGCAGFRFANVIVWSLNRHIITASLERAIESIQSAVVLNPTIDQQAFFEKQVQKSFGDVYNDILTYSNEFGQPKRTLLPQKERDKLNYTSSLKPIDIQHVSTLSGVDHMKMLIELYVDEIEALILSGKPLTMTSDRFFGVFLATIPEIVTGARNILLLRASA